MRNADRIPYFESLNEVMNTYEGNVRGSGRTTALIDSMNNGDIFIVHSNRFALDVQDIIKSKGKSIPVFAAENEAKLREVLLNHARGYKGKIVIDHHLLHIITMRKIAEFEKMVNIYAVQNQPFYQPKE